MRNISKKDKNLLVLVLLAFLLSFKLFFYFVRHCYCLSFLFSLFPSFFFLYPQFFIFFLSFFSFLYFRNPFRVFPLFVVFLIWLRLANYDKVVYYFQNDFSWRIGFSSFVWYCVQFTIFSVKKFSLRFGLLSLIMNIKRVSYRCLTDSSKKTCSRDTRGYPSLQARKHWVSLAVSLRLKTPFLCFWIYLYV